jgi:hypothetical protein
MDTAHPTVRPVFSQMLRVRLIEDACLRAHAGQLQTALAEAAAVALEVKRASGLIPRLLGKVGRKAGAHPPEESAQILAREKEAQRQYREIEQLVQRYTSDLDTLITMHLQETIPVFYEYSAARKRLADWEGAVDRLQAALRAVLKALGQTRKATASGDNQSKPAGTATARERLDQAGEMMRAFEERLQAVNDKSREIGGLAEVKVITCQTTVKSLPGLDNGAMQKECDRLTKQLEAFAAGELSSLKEPVVQAALEREAEARNYAAKYRQELRQFSDRQMKPDDMARAIPLLLARFRP